MKKQEKIYYYYMLVKKTPEVYLPIIKKYIEQKINLFQNQKKINKTLF